ncbi:MAG TPA: hypothetical protein VK705_00400 [Ferruginibacter sp.]|jgi:hypothetical protein|nr:hypothetical protein [Ferruginibacter sp.]
MESSSTKTIKKGGITKKAAPRKTTRSKTPAKSLNFIMDEVQKNYVNENPHGKSIGFNSLVAIKYNVHTALIFNMMIFWYLTNIKNDRNYTDGFNWTFNSVASIRKSHPYLSQKIIGSSIHSLLSDGLLIKATKNYNAHGYDKTSWYRIDEDKVIGVFNIGIMDILNPK